MHAGHEAPGGNPMREGSDDAECGLLLHDSSRGHVSNQAFDIAETLSRCIWALESYTPDGEGLQKDVKQWATLLEELGVYRMLAQGLKCLWYPHIKQYEQILKDRILDLCATYGELIQCSS
jgi:hypothetical protein